MGTQDDKVKALFDALKDRGQMFVDSEKFQSYLTAAARFHHYSANNQFLIWLAAPDTVAVNSYKRWQSLGRQVRQGESGIRIIAPRPVKFHKTVETESGTEDREFNYLRFTAVPVFAYEQTDPVPEFAGEPWEPMAFPVLTGADAAERLGRLVRWLENDGTPVTFREDIPGAHGYYEPAAKRITVELTFDPNYQMHVLLHEAAHALHYQRYAAADEHMKSQAYREIVAESAAYIVASVIGLDSSLHAEMYVGAQMYNNPDAAEWALPAIQRIAADLISAVQDDESGTAGVAA